MVEKQQNFMPRYKGQKKYNSEQFLEFVKDREERYELINGKIYMMASPSVIHQDIALFIGRKVGNYLEGKPCKAFIAPLDVVLFKKDDEKDKSQNVFQPDVFVVCDPKKIGEGRIYGAPDLVFEIISPSSEIHDYFKKFWLYMQYGVKEYWIVNPETKQVFVNINEKEKPEEDTESVKYAFSDIIKVGIFDDLYIDLSEFD